MRKRQQLTVDDVARRLDVDPRTARRRCEVWIQMQGRAGLPRVKLVRPRGKRGRPGYRVDGDSLTAWIRGAGAASNDNTR